MNGCRMPVLMAWLLAIVALCACAAQPPVEEAHSLAVGIVATQDFGRQLMFDEKLELELGTSAMAALKQVAEVETAYGGGFVDAINGVRSGFSGGRGTKADWFFYINGIQSNVGALDYRLHDGDVQHWDFHSWSFHHFIPATVGCFPEPFWHGYGGEARRTVIAYADGVREEAGNLARSLERLGVSALGVKGFGELSEDERETSNLVLLGTLDTLPVSELDQAWKRLGFFAHFQDGGIMTYNPEGEVAAEYGAGTGLIQAAQSIWNPKGVGACENVVWMVSGVDEAGVKAAASALLERHAEFKNAFAVVIAGGEIIRVP